MAGNEECKQLIEHILELEAKVYQALRPLGSQQWFLLNCTMTQLKAMLLLFADGPARMSALSSHLGVSLSTTTGIVERLVKQGFVLREKQPKDRRVVVCQLTHKGQKAMDKLWQSRQIWANGFLQRMSFAKLQAIAAAMEVIFEAVTMVTEDSQARQKNT